MSQKLRTLPRSRNFSIIENLAYTEDKVLIYNLYVSQIPPKTPQDILVKYFEKYGKLNEITFYARKKLCTRISFPNEIYVNYAKSSSATKVLLDSPHQIFGRRLKIIPCDSWQQPCFAIMQDEEERKKFPQLKEHDDFLKKFNSLDDDSLLNIYKFVRISKQAVLAQTSARFQEVSTIYNRASHGKLDLKILSFMTTLECHEFLRLAGPSIRYIYATRISNICGRTLEFIAAHCTKLREFDITDCNCRCSDFRTFISKITSLTKLRMKACSLKPTTFAKVGNLKKLKELNITNNSHLDGQYLSDIPNLRKLNMNDCSHIRTQYIDEILTNISGLKALDVRGCILNENNFFCMAESCKNLEVLKITANYMCKYECIGSLPKLRTLEIHYPNYVPMEIRSELFDELLSNATRLENLSISMKAHMSAEKASKISSLRTLKRLSLFGISSIEFDCCPYFSAMDNLEYLALNKIESLTDEILFNIVSHLHNLKELDIQSNIHISNMFITKISEYLMNHILYNENPLIIHTSETLIKDPFKNAKTHYELKCVKYVILREENCLNNGLLADSPTGQLHERIEFEIKPML